MIHENTEAAERWEKLGISNTFIFYKVMRDNADLCLGLLQRILPELNIREIEFLDVEKTYEAGMDIRGLRLDAFAGDDLKRVYDIEMQAYNKDDIRKRSRYHQAMVDTELLDKGAFFGNLNESYVIFICTFDLFERGRHRYTFRNRCDEDFEIVLDDKAVKVFLNAEGVLDDVSPELKAFLNLVTGAPSEDPFVRKMEKAIERIKLDKEARRSYMTWEMEMKNREHIALREGIEQGIEQGIGETLDVWDRLMAGATREELLSEGKDGDLIERCIKRLNACGSISELPKTSV